VELSHSGCYWALNGADKSVSSQTLVVATPLLIHDSYSWARLISKGALLQESR
jgi:hypothetical protein